LFRFGQAFRALLLAGVVVPLSSGLAGQVAAPQGRFASVSFTAGQAAAGEAAYKQSCASCHGQNLDDGEFAPPLKGVEFRGRWGGTQPAEPLFTYMEERMPPSAPGSLGANVYAQILAYMFRENGMQPSLTQPLPSDPAALRKLMMPGFIGGPSGGLAFGVDIPPAPSRRSPLEHYSAVTDAMLANPPAGEWLNWRRTLDAQGFSPLRQITKQNIAEMRPAWVWSLPPGPNEATPLFHDGVLFVHGFGDKLQALDAVTGDLLWQYSHRLPQGQNTSVKRHIALYGDKVYMATSDVRLIALDVKTGRVAWDRPIADPKLFGMTGGPLAAKGKIIVGTTGRNPGGNFIVAFDANTGQEAWRFNTIAQPGEPGGDTWNGLPVEKRNGGSVWVSGSYDPALNLVFFGPAPTYDTGPLRNLTAGQNNDTLWTNATLAINADTGKLAWYYQHQPNDQWDFDWAFSRLIFTMPVNGTMKKVVATSGKQAIYDIVEAETGTYVSSMDLGLQDAVIGIDPKTGVKQINPRLVPDGRDTITVCPHAGGAKSWIPESMNPDTRTLVVPMVESCMDLIPVAPGGRGSLSTGVRWTLRPRPDSDGNYGRLQAINLETKKTLWTVRQRAPRSSGVLMTAGGLVFAGALDRSFAAYDDATGKELWRTRLNEVPNSAPISFMANGKQYIALTVGGGGAQAATFPALVPEIRNPPDRSAALWVFEVPR
jgi:PQQ-dependent dehydrogenase (methanol/ethanol family)